MKTQRILRSAATLWALLLASTAFAQTIVVNTAADVTDFGGAQAVANLPGPDGKVSLAEAGLASDNTPGVQTIAFAVPQHEWTYQWLYPGRAVLQPFLGFRVFQTAILDATTQTAFTGDTNPAGAEVVIWTGAYMLDNVGGVMRGFDSTQITVSGGSGNIVAGNSNINLDVYDSPFTVVGGTNPGDGNTCGTIKIDRSNDNVVIGNTTTRVRVLGWVDGGQPATNTRIGGPTLAERNYITGYGTWNSEGAAGGTTVQIFDSIGTVVENNWIGTTPDGLAQGSLASTTGIGFEGENHAAVIRGNRIAGILGHGTGPHFAGYLWGTAISVYGIGSGLSITGNTIGLNANGQPVLGSVTGIGTANYYLGTVQGVVIGGPGSGDGNEIAGHLSSGISVSNTYAGVRISGNSIHDNGGLGIDLVTNGFVTGVTPNDTLDPDVGGNGLQNYPLLQTATGTGSSVSVAGTLNSSASSAFTLEFFASPVCDASGYGEGQKYLGSTTVTTNASGNASFAVTLAASATPGWFVSATATAANGSSSEFAACVTVTGAPSPWTNVGQGLAGINGVPQLSGNGTLQPLTSLSVFLASAPALTTTTLVAGYSALNAPFKGGVLVPNTDLVIPGLVTNGSGGWLLTSTWPAGVPSGFTTWMQVWIADISGPAGYIASNGLRAITP